MRVHNISDVVLQHMTHRFKPVRYYNTFSFAHEPVLRIKPGDRVVFSLKGTRYAGLVTRITKRATVLVEDKQGTRYSDGRSYTKFYVPLHFLRPHAQ